ncbi:MAG: iron transporter, partial [bacterium]
IFLEVCRSVGWIEHIINSVFPILRIFGLSSKSALVWITGTIFGLIYGAAIIIEELKEGKLTRAELAKLHLSIGLQHSVIEDPLLFLALGINPLWLWIPRFLITLLVVHLYALWKKVAE